MKEVDNYVVASLCISLLKTAAIQSLKDFYIDYTNVNKVEKQPISIRDLRVHLFARERNIRFPQNPLHL